jgi:hypothetical protein
MSEILDWQLRELETGRARIRELSEQNEELRQSLEATVKAFGLVLQQHPLYSAFKAWFLINGVK